MLTASSLFRRTLDSTNRAGTQLCILSVVAVAFASVIVGGGTHFFVLRALRDAPAYWTNGELDQFSPSQATAVPGDPDELLKFTAALQETLTASLQKNSEMTPADAEKKAYEQVAVFMFTEAAMVLPWLSILLIIYFAYTLLMKGTLACILADSRMSISKAFRKAIRLCVPLWILGLCVSVVICLVTIPILLFTLFLKSLLTLSFAFVAAAFFGFVAYVRLISAPAFMVQDGCGIMESMRRSSRLIEGKTLRVTGIVLLWFVSIVLITMSVQLLCNFVIGIVRVHSPYAGYLQYAVTFAGLVIAFFYSSMTYRLKELLVAESSR